VLSTEFTLPKSSTIKAGSVRQSHFAPAFLFLPRARREALKILYQVCRALDDAVDIGHVDPRGYLQAWRESFSLMKADPLKIYGDENLSSEFLRIAKLYGIPMSVMTDLIDKGVVVDLLQTPRFETPMDVERYCYGVAGTVGVACLPIFGVDAEAGRAFAIRLGIAVQWINLVRDVGVDAAMGRIYLPLEHLELFGYTEQDLLNRKSSPEFLQLMSHEASVARSHYSRAMELMPASQKKALLPARIMGQIYFDLLRKCERRRFPVFQQKIRLNWVEKTIAAAKAVYE
jgi:15-cis-phytoene synthase